MIGKAIFTDNIEDYMYKITEKNNDAIIVANQKYFLYTNGCKIFTYNQVKNDFAGFLTYIKNRLIILTDIEILYRYDTPITRFFVNIVSKETSRKIVIGHKMIRNNIYDIFSYMFFLDKKIIDINHYWCFKANHMEENMFTGEPINMLDINYLAQKLKNHVIFDKEPTNNFEKAVYNEIIST